MAKEVIEEYSRLVQQTHQGVSMDEEFLLDDIIDTLMERYADIGIHCNTILWAMCGCLCTKSSHLLNVGKKKKRGIKNVTKKMIRITRGNGKEIARFDYTEVIGLVDMLPSNRLRTCVLFKNGEKMVIDEPYIGVIGAIKTELMD